ncbi:hypothetical protein [Microbacterium sp. 77mftsu3.1]|uniref:hypothetical protein n=1 Tax=Microbacterium sp. 77mftsu3.1 TaxID=1761802 RepID=UPI00088BC03B|nr:hypothetical protein [Microbacterium sp. 77mftsu3.1]SDH56366.1 hypothetical protein SAMN04488590_3589 [Microbacterium sp. 77mftsu3.1]
MTSFESQHPRISNGTFTDKAQSAPELTLGEQTTSARIVEVPVRGRWTERNVLPTPRHRTPRDVQRDIDVTVTIPVIASDEAPVGITLPANSFGPNQNARELRVHGGQLYQELTDRDGTPVPADPDTIFSRIFDRWGHGRPHLDGANAWQAEEAAQTRVDDLLVIDGTVWEETSEPVYNVGTFGFNNGTYVGIESATRYAEAGHAMPEWVYPADQREEAIAAAIETSQKRGDLHPFTGHDVPTIGLTGNFQPGSTFAPAPRINYVSPWEADNTPGDPERVARELLAFRQQLLTVPGAVIEVEDGWGGTTKTVDPSQLTSRQAEDYKRYTELEQQRRLTDR